MSEAGAGFWLLHADGASAGNPGRGGAGAALYAPSGELAAEISRYLGPRVTNNEAEYMALLAGLNEALGRGAARLHIRMDSELVVNHVLGIYKVRNPRLFQLYQEVKTLLAKLEAYDIQHVRREMNALADSLASKAARHGRE